MIVLLYGTRPEAIKLGPVAAELRALGHTPTVICTGQHTSLLRGTPAESDLAGGWSCHLPSDGNVLAWTTRASAHLVKMLGETETTSTLVVVQGDTMSALAGARAASQLGLALAHVEAGVRSHHRQEPWPEEPTRVEIDTLADWFLAPTSTSYANLAAEGVPVNRIFVTGNTGVSALTRYAAPCLRTPEPLLVVTLHRREFLESTLLGEVVNALVGEALHRPTLQFVWPLHPALAKRAEVQSVLTGAPANLQVVEPLPYRAFVNVLGGAQGILTDSGGLAEDAATIGVPAVHFRAVTDRPEAVEAGVATVIGPTAQGVHKAVEVLLGGTLRRGACACFGEPTAAAQVARVLDNVSRRG